VPKLKKLQRFRLENPVAGLSDLFAQISRSLPGSNILSREDGSYSLTMNTLRVDYTVLHRFPKEKTQRLAIKQEWESDGCFENFTLQDVYDDLKEWFVEEVLRNLALLNDESREWVARMRGMIAAEGQLDGFALDLAGMCYKLRQSMVEYHTNCIGRGLQSLSVMRFSKYVDARNHAGEAMIKRIYEGMLHDENVTKELGGVFGRADDKMRLEYLRSGKLRMNKLFTFSEQDNSSKWESMCYELLWLCKFYAGMDVSKGLHDHEHNGGYFV
jgi:hypothetical protein